MISPKQLHEWYLEACRKLNPKSYNPKAQKKYEDLTKEQKFIDNYIANKIVEQKKLTKKQIPKRIEVLFILTMVSALLLINYSITKKIYYKELIIILFAYYGLLIGIVDFIIWGKKKYER